MMALSITLILAASWRGVSELWKLWCMPQASTVNKIHRFIFSFIEITIFILVGSFQLANIKPHYRINYTFFMLLYLNRLFGAIPYANGNEWTIFTLFIVMILAAIGFAWTPIWMMTSLFAVLWILYVLFFKTYWLAIAVPIIFTIGMNEVVFDLVGLLILEDIPLWMSHEFVSARNICNGKNRRRRRQQRGKN